MIRSRRRGLVVVGAIAACAVGAVFAWRARWQWLEAEAIHRNNLGVALLEANWRTGASPMDAAVLELEAALRCNPDYTLARLNLGLAHYYRGLYPGQSDGFERALEVLEPLLASDPRNPFVRFTLGSVRFQRNEHMEALEHFAAVRLLDPGDTSALFFLGSCLQSLGRDGEAIRAFQGLVEAYPRHKGAYYRLHILFRAAGRVEDVRATLEEFRSISSKESTDYLFQDLALRVVPMAPPPDRYATPIPDSRSLRPRPDPPPRYADVTRERGVAFVHSGPGPGGETGTGCAFGDWNGDLRLDLFLADSAGKHALYEQGAGGRFTDVTASAQLRTDLQTATACAFCDLDDDLVSDLVLAGVGGVRVFQGTGGAFADVTVPWGFREAVSPLDALTALAIADHDHDGDLDVFAGGGVIPGDTAPQPSRLFRNNRNGTFTEVGAASGVADAKDAGRFVRAAFFTDLGDDVALDLVTTDQSGEPRVFLSRKDGTFARADVTPGGKLDAEVRAVLPEIPPPGESRSFGDFDGDGGLDRLTVRCGLPAVLERRVNVPESWLTVRLRTPRRKPEVGQSNGFGIGSKVEARWVGSWQKKELRLGNGQGGCDAPELVFDLGREARIDFARARFPSAGRRSAKDVGSNQVITIEEPDFAGSSCPAVFAWNGSRFEFITDTISAGIFGELTGPSTY